MILLNFAHASNQSADASLEFGVVPGVSVAGVSLTAHEDIGTLGSFRVSLDAPSPPGGLTINFLLSGSAAEGVDYVAVGSSIFIQESEENGLVLIQPIDENTDLEGTETIVLTVQAGTGYTVGTNDQATITIIDAENPKNMLHMNGTGGKTIIPATATNDELLSLINELNTRITILEG